MKINFKKIIIISTVVLFATINHLCAQTVIPVGANSTYKTIQTAYNSIKDAAATTPISGAYIIEIQGDYEPTSGTTLETFPITLNAIIGASATNTITIRPANGVKKTLSYPNQTVVATGITCASGATSITVTNDVSILSTASYVGGQGVPNNPFKLLAGVDAVNKTLTLASGTITSAKASATLYFGPKLTKTVILDGAKYVIIDGVSRTDANTGLTIANPNCIYAQTIHLTGSAQFNTVKNCIIRGANQTSTDGGAGVGATVFFNTSSFNTFTMNNVCDMEDGISPMPIAAFQATGSGTNLENTISENIIYNIENKWASAAANTGFISFGSPYNANSYNNYVLNNKLFWTRTANFQSGSTIALIGTGGSMNGIGNRFEGNTIGYANADGTGTSELNGTGVTFKAVNNFKNFTCKNNIISNINITGIAFTGIEFATSNTSTPSADDVCSGNTVQNIKLTPSAAGTLVGIKVNAANPFNSNIKNNIVSNLKVEHASLLCTAIGIDVTGTATAKIFNYTNNVVKDITAGLSSSSTANVAYGIRTGANAAAIERNLVYNIAALNNTNTAVVYGIQTAGGNATGTTVKNNVVRLGMDVANDAVIYGIYQGALTAATNIWAAYNNSVFIGGTAPASAAKNTFDFYTAYTTTVTGTNAVKNNIFVNQRGFTDGGTPTAVNYAIAIPTANKVITASDNNLYYTSNVGLLNTTPKATLALWKDAVATGSDAASKDTDPLFVDATNLTTPNLKITSALSDANTNGGEFVTDDFYGFFRGDFTTNDLGAYAIGSDPTRPTLDATTAVNSITTSTASTGGNITIDGGSSITVSGVCLSETANPTIANSTTTDGITTTGAFTSSIGGLTANTTYNVRSYATNGSTTGYGTNVSFTTLPAAPISTAATSKTATGLTANWTAPTQGDAAITYTLEYGAMADMSSYASVIYISGLNSAITGLVSNTTYYYRVKSMNITGKSATSDIQSAVTLPAAPTSTAATSTLATSFTANWTAPTQGTTAFTYTLEYGTAADLAGATVVTDIASTNLNSVISGLNPNTTYYYRVKAVNASGAGASSTIQSVVTLPVKPTITTTSISPTSVAAIPVTITFNEAVTGFDATDLTVVNGNISDFVASSSTVYTATITAIAKGDVTVDIAAGAALDALTNPTAVATQLIVNYDGTTEIETIKNNSLVYSTENAIVISSKLGQSATIYSVSGQLVKSLLLTSDKVSIPATKGFYIVSIGKERVKVLVN